MIFGISREEIKLAFRGVHYHIKKLGEELMAEIADVKAAADKAVADIATLRGKVNDAVAKIADLQAKLDAIPVPADHSAELQAIADELNAATAPDDPAPAAPSA